MQNKATELKPCPFCDAAVRLDSYQEGFKEKTMKLKPSDKKIRNPDYIKSAQRNFKKYAAFVQSFTEAAAEIKKDRDVEGLLFLLGFSQTIISECGRDWHITVHKKEKYKCP